MIKNDDGDPENPSTSAADEKTGKGQSSYLKFGEQWNGIFIS